MPFIFWGLDTFDWIGDHEVPPYVFAATGPSHLRRASTESIGNLYLSSSMRFFSNGILDLCYHPIRLSLIV